MFLFIELRKISLEKNNYLYIAEIDCASRRYIKINQIEMIGFLKYIYHNTLLGKLLIYVYHNTKNRIVPEKLFLELKYKNNFGKKPNLKEPKTLNEKIIWLKLNDRTPLHTQCADKYAVREYVSEKIGEQYLVPLLYQTKNPKDIVADNLPNIPCIIKTNHDSGGVFIVRDKATIEWQRFKEKFKKTIKKELLLAVQGMAI